MNRPKTLIGLALFFGIITMLLWGVGNSINDPEFEYIRKVAIGGDDLYKAENVSYAHLWESEMERMGVMDYQEGEYGLSDRINFKGVYHSTHSYSTQYTESRGDTVLDKIVSYFSFGYWDPSYLKWEHEHMTHINSGEHIYIYPHINFNMPGSDPSIINLVPDFAQYLFVRTFDAYSISQEWLSGPYIIKLPCKSDWIETIPNLDIGIMGSYDLYYVIDVAYFNQDFLSSIPGINYLTDSDIKTAIKEGDARFMEKWGGVIIGDNHQEAPSSLSYHEITYSSGGIHSFFDTINDIKMGWLAFTNTGNEIIDYGFTMIMSVFGIIFGLSIYYEIKSYLPFISGGEGE